MKKKRILVAILKKRILVAILNWGLGHATRCIPIIRELERKNFEPVIASDGAALKLLKKNFREIFLRPFPPIILSTAKKQFY